MLCIGELCGLCELQNEHNDNNNKNWNCERKEMKTNIYEQTEESREKKSMALCASHTPPRFQCECVYLCKKNIYLVQWLWPIHAARMSWLRLFRHINIVPFCKPLLKSNPHFTATLFARSLYEQQRKNGKKVQEINSKKHWEWERNGSLINVPCIRISLLHIWMVCRWCFMLSNIFSKTIRTLSTKRERQESALFTRLQKCTSNSSALCMNKP